MIAKAVSETGDIRLGFRILTTAGLLAEGAHRYTVDAAYTKPSTRKQPQKIQRTRHYKRATSRAEEEIRETLTARTTKGFQHRPHVNSPRLYKEIYEPA